MSIIRWFIWLQLTSRH
jgi:hypothetical protein